VQGRERTCGELSDLLQVSRRTVMRDVGALMLIGIPITSRGGPKGGYSLPDESTLQPLELTGSEACLLLLVLEVLERMRDVPYANSRETLLAKVRALVPASQLGNVAERIANVRFQVPLRSAKASHLDRLIELCGSWVELSYQGQSGIARHTAFLRRVFADAGLWYVGTHLDGSESRLRADRVLEVRAVPDQGAVPQVVPYDSPKHPLVRVTLSGRGLRAIEREPDLGHRVQGMTAPAVLEFRCPPSELPWYARYLGSMGEDAVVSEPAELVAMIAERARKILEIYDP
jgi:predicted DNA-binding transcriptional regulator YafY